MIYVYYVLVLLNLLMLLFKKQKISFVDIYFVSSLFYYINSFFGYVYSLHSPRIPIPIEISDTTYIILCINQLLIFLFYLSPKNKITKLEVKKNFDSLLVLSYKLILLLLFLSALFYTVDMDLFSRIEFNKSETLQDSSFFETYFKYGTFYFITVGFFLRNKLNLIWKILMVYPLFVTFLMGHRSFLILSAISFFIIYTNENSSLNSNLFFFFKKNRKLIISALGIVLFVYIIKGVSGALFTGNYELVKERLSNFTYYLDSFKMSESNVILNHINNTVNYDFKIAGSTYGYILTLFVPFVGRYFPINSFNYYLQIAFYPEYREGSLGSSFLAEAYSQGSIFLIVMIILLIIFFANFLYKIFINPKYSIFLRSWALVVGIEATFYIHRNSLYTFFVRSRVYLYITIFFFLTYLGIKILNKTIKVGG